MEIGRRLQFVILVFILLLGFGLRFHLLNGQSFWNDEGNSARLSERSIQLIIEGTASDIHPPLYYLFLRGWRELVGETEFGLRAFSAFAGVLTVALVGAVGKVISIRYSVFGERYSVSGDQYSVNVLERGSRLSLGIHSPVLVLVAMLLTAVNPASIYYSQEARMYALLGLLVVGSSYCLLNWGTAVFRETYFVKRKRIFGWAVAYVLLSAAGLYTHYFYPAVLVAQNLLVLIWLIQFTIHHSPFKIHNLIRPVGQWIVMMLATLLLYAPWLPTFVQQFGADDLSERGAFFSFLLEAVGWLAFGSTLAAEWVTWAVVGVVVILLLGILNGRRAAIIPVSLLFIPVLFMYFAGTVQPEFMKFLMVAVPFFCLLLATAVTFGKTWQRLIPALLLLVIIPLGTVQSLHNLYHNPAYARADYRSMAERIEADNHPNAGIILNAPNQWEVFTYYYPDDTAVYPLPQGRSRPQPEVIDAALTEIASQHERIYVLFWGDSARDPERLVERWLDEHAFKATEQWVGDVRFVTYAVPPEPATEMDTAVNLPFGDAITLEGLTLNETSLSPGDILQVTLFWQTAVPLEQRYKVFLHLIGPDGQLVSQRDSEPGGNLKPTNIWQPGETVIDNHGLLIPADLPSGEYALYLGLYDVADPSARLPIQTDEGEVDRWLVTAVSIEPQK